MRLPWKQSSVSAGSIVLVQYAATADGVIERRIDQSLPTGEQTSYRWASYAAAPSLDAWSDGWVDGPGPSDEPPSDIDWHDVSEAQVRQIAEAAS